MLGKNCLGKSLSSRGEGSGEDGTGEETTGDSAARKAPGEGVTTKFHFILFKLKQIFNRLGAAIESNPQRVWMRGGLQIPLSF